MDQKKFDKYLKETPGLEVKLTKGELGTLIKYFDKDGNGKVKFAEFKQFLKHHASGGGFMSDKTE
eukprot:8383940-Ditylum_brightwellii.AAC.1